MMADKALEILQFHSHRTNDRSDHTTYKHESSLLPAPDHVSYENDL